MLPQNQQFSHSLFNFPEIPFTTPKIEDLNLPVACFVKIKDAKSTPKEIHIFFRSSPKDPYQQFNRVGTKNRNPEFLGRNPKARKLKSCNNDDDDYTVKSQKKDRNVVSNIFHHLFKFLCTSDQTNELVQKIIITHCLSINIDKFLELLERDKNNLRTYVTVQHINQLWFNSSAERKQYSKIMRILGRLFLKKNGLLSIYYSNKFNSKSKLNHYQGIRTMIETVSNKKLNLGK